MIAIIGEGITEKWYMESLKDLLKGVQYKVFKPTTNTKMKELENAIKKCADDGYTTIYCMIDMDIKQESRDVKQAYENLKRKYHKQTYTFNKRDGIVAFVQFFESYPSTEMFFRYHFDYKTAGQTNEGLKKWLNERCGYEDAERFLVRHSLHDVFACHGGSLDVAIQNAKRSVDAKNRAVDGSDCCYSEIGEMIELLGYKPE